MDISQKGLDLIKEFEGLRLKAYLCPAGVWTIGYGTTHGVRKGQTCTAEEAEGWLRRDCAKFEDAVEACVTAPMSQHQFDALTSFTYNLGPGNLRQSTLIRKFNAGDAEEAANQFLRWNRAGGRVLAGLTRRRKAESVMFRG